MESRDVDAAGLLHTTHCKDVEGERLTRFVFQRYVDHIGSKWPSCPINVLIYRKHVRIEKNTMSCGHACPQKAKATADFLHYASGGPPDNMSVLGVFWSEVFPNTHFAASEAGNEQKIQAYKKNWMYRLGIFIVVDWQLKITFECSLLRCQDRKVSNFFLPWPNDRLFQCQWVSDAMNECVPGWLASGWSERRVREWMLEWVGKWMRDLVNAWEAERRLQARTWLWRSTDDNVKFTSIMLTDPKSMAKDLKSSHSTNIHLRWQPWHFFLFWVSKWNGCGRAELRFASRQGVGSRNEVLMFCGCRRDWDWGWVRVLVLVRFPVLVCWYFFLGRNLTMAVIAKNVGNKGVKILEHLFFLLW